MLLGDSTWREDDRTLALALQLYEDGLCPCGCGFPRSRSWDEDMDGWYELEETVCYARRARDEWEQKQRKRKGDPVPGVLGVVVDTTVTG